MSDKKVSLITATALVVANMIGTGAFTSLGFQVGLAICTCITFIMDMRWISCAFRGSKLH